LAAARGNPRILAFVCSWHPLTAADNAGADGRSYGTGTTIVPVDCAGMVSGAAILRAFSGKVDGVLVAACGRGDCHYTNGNESCERVLEETQDLLRLAGIAPARLRLDLSSDVDGGRFVEMLEEFSTELAGLDGKSRKKPRTAKRKPAAKKAPPKKKAAAKKRAKPAKKTTAKTTKKRPARKATKTAPKKSKKAAAKKAPKKATKQAASKQTKKKAAPKRTTKKAKKPTRKKTGTRTGRKR
jgi:coenzyme F420-reducing hydrogenase delta subunit